MFTGIIETSGTVKEVIPNGSNISFWIASPISGELKTDQSVSHDGVCLTIEETRPGEHKVTAIDETLEKSNLGKWKEGIVVNLERSMVQGSRIDGHMVQGHVDCVATCTKIKQEKGSWVYTFAFPKKFARLVIEKGSISVNGISLTCYNVKKKSFQVAIIPFTFEHTNIREVKENDHVNLEFDIIGKYISRQRELEKP
jgi:riboflavin synthase